VLTIKSTLGLTVNEAGTGTTDATTIGGGGIRFGAAGGAGVSVAVDVGAGVSVGTGVPVDVGEGVGVMEGVHVGTRVLVAVGFIINWTGASIGGIPLGVKVGCGVRVALACAKTTCRMGLGFAGSFVISHNNPPITTIFKTSNNPTTVARCMGVSLEISLKICLKVSPFDVLFFSFKNR